MYTVIGSTRTRAARVVWMLEEIGLPYDLIPHRAGSPEVKDFNPAGKVPVLIVGGTTLTDSTAILQFLADQLVQDQLGEPILPGPFQRSGRVSQLPVVVGEEL